MHRLAVIFAVLLAFVCVCATPSLAAPKVATTSSSWDSPWIDQYIEQIPGAGGGKRRDPQTGTWVASSGLGTAEIASLASAGGERFAAAMAAGTPAVPKRSLDTDAITANNTKSLAQALLPGGDAGIGLMLPILIVGSLFGAIALAGSRISRD